MQAAGAGSGPHPPDAEHVPGEYARKARASRIREQPGTPLEADALVNSKEPDSQVEATPVVASEPPVSSALSGEVGAEIESDNAPLGVVVEAVPQNPVEVEAKDIVSEEVSPEEQENSGDVEDAVSETSTLQPHQPDTPKDGPSPTRGIFVRQAQQASQSSSSPSELQSPDQRVDEGAPTSNSPSKDESDKGDEDYEDDFDEEEDIEEDIPDE